MITQKEITQNMASQLGISGMPEDKQKIVIAKLGENITKRITIAILKNLPEEARTEFDSIQDEKNEEKHVLGFPYRRRRQHPTGAPRATNAVAVQ